MKAVMKITFLNDDGEKFFGEGPAQLLHGIEETGSLRSAAISMNMAYTKALKILKNAEAALGFPLTTRISGGKDGGGSTLTPEGKAFLRRYEAYRDACRETSRNLLRTYFPEIGCVIMASGMSRRFGSNKLMASFDGAPMIFRALKATEGQVQRRVVVTRHLDVAALCREQGVDVIFHDLPHRNDTVRLGLEAVGDVDGCLFLPGDQPLLRQETVARLIRHWEADQTQIVRPACNGIPGSPVLFPQWTFPELLTLPEGKGGNWVMQRHPERVSEMAISDPGELADADTPETFAKLQTHISR